ncbi:unnamed protein product [Triticum turgidum subsp. durum]|uniref:Uncharacterized protein n=1 Tax=Triticum turgidum subsp. durum TaxID=4567 RepID=A0A9R1BTD2_TRITD|nr:unnamed protein product [Triticum turgidum subsp. durum]
MSGIARRYMARTQIWVSSSLPACAKNSEPAVQQMKPTRTMINFSDLMSAPIRRRRQREEMKWRQLEGLLGGLVQFSPAASFARFGVQKSLLWLSRLAGPSIHVRLSLYA